MTEREQLLAQQRVLRYKGWLATHEIGERPRDGDRGGGCRRRREAPPELLGQVPTDAGDAVEEVSQHPGRSFH